MITINSTNAGPPSPDSTDTRREHDLLDVSPYLTRPLRRLDQVLREREARSDVPTLESGQ